ncbi:hypothetical protein A3C59_01785 [Candidatus Daviesbacteria bacterium RIFCSPHIGHO2_02_FULL_36_13]|uniref:Beta-lactamase n=1 Tax=Candidatus Daviesbacteria bacterium RIFCSPHIGHO2_02_FULL_36_13 TaxID=1797768 RepID=A0A1F5JW99_9BACT|nr:MAG: hypothetical protein A3C59_01785 [Candidatus Daviesbacteria bacterium RIFCSPHIGHO2_02_FULL_36_13]
MRKKRSLGFGFPDELAKVTSKRSFSLSKVGYFKKEEKEWKDLLLPNFDLSFGSKLSRSPWRITAFYIICLISFFVIFIRLYHLQIAKGEENKRLADGNRIQIKLIHAPRGVIYDRNGKILASNSPAFRLFNPESKKARLITRDEALELEVKNDPRAINLEVDNVRTYPMGEQFAHVLGYVGEISEDQLKTDFKKYNLGDRVGKSGIEAQYESLLRGIDGGEIIEVDSSGRKLRTLRENVPIAGQNIYLTIDADLQNIIYQQFAKTLPKVGSCCGAALAVDPKSGQVLALLSYPSFDPNYFTSKQDDSAILEIFQNPSSPILNRAISGAYPPGSTYKIVSSLAALSSGKINANTAFQDNGIIHLGSFSFSNWYFTQYGRTEGSVNLLKGLQRSNDIYFYEIARIIGEKELIDWSRKLKLGSKMEIDLPGEEMGLVPDDGWKRENFGEGWYPGDTLHMAIGQGFLLTTPLQVLGFTSFVANNGVLYKPQLILSDFKPKILISNITSQERIDLIKDGLELVTKNGGTAWPFFTFPISTAGKTGTAEFGDSRNRTHAWYTGYGPSTDPKIAMTVLIEGGGEGSSVASPIVKEAFRYYLSEDKNNLIKDLYQEASPAARTLGE